MSKRRLIQAADLFCGAGGTSTGMIQAIQAEGYDYKLLAINHWDIAIATHELNYPDQTKVTHKCQNLDKVDPTELIPGGTLDILVASPECKHHSNARGGKPRSDQKRADAWLLMRWVEKLNVRAIFIENVREFVSWGPLTAKGQPDKRYRGAYFDQFLTTLRINYHVEWKLVNCANYGDATTRVRFFLMAVKKGYRFEWPAQTHASLKELKKLAAQPKLYDGAQLAPWRTARQDVIDWTLQGKSIFLRKKPLSKNTLRRIFAGLKKHSGLALMATGGRDGQMQPRSVDQPVGTVMPNSRLNLVEAKPFVMKLSHTKSKNDHTREIDAPLTVITGLQEHAVIEPCIVNMKGKSNARSIDEPTVSQTTKIHQYLLEPKAVLVNHKGKDGRSRGVDSPSFTQCAGGNHQSLVELNPYIVPNNHGTEARSHGIDEPMPGITTFDAWSVIEPHLLAFFDGFDPAQAIRTIDGDTGDVEADAFLVKSYEGSDSASLDTPLPVITANFEHLALAEPSVVKYYGTAKGSKSVDQPLDAVTGTDRFALLEGDAVAVAKETFGEKAELVRIKGATPDQDIVGLYIPELQIIIDIRFRMLQPHELAAAMSFPKEYQFSGNRENKVMQIGNAVPCRTARIHIAALLKAVETKRKAKPRLRKAA